MKHTIETVEITDPFGNLVKHENVIITYEDGSVESFLVDENNPRYVAWSEENN